MKKIIPILAASMLIQSFSGFGIVHGAVNSYPLTYSFDSGMEDWELGESTGNPTLTHETDGDNGYLKLKAAEGTSYNLKDGINVVPNAFIEPESAFIMEADSETVVSVDIRTSDMSTFVRGFMINRDQLDESVENELQYSHSTLWAWNRSNKLSTYEKNSTKNVGPYKGTKSTKIGEDLLEDNVWYTFKTTLYSDENGYPEYIKVAIYEGDTLKVESQKSEIENDTLKLSNKITRLDIALMHSTVTVPAGGAEVDFDNVKVYKVSNDRTWGIEELPENGVFTNIEKIGVRFSGKMDETTLNTANIRLVTDGRNVEYVGEYNKTSYIYTIIPTEELTSGKYSVVIDKAAVNGIDESGNVISGLADNAEEEIEFTIFNGSIPEAKNVKVSGRLKENSKLKVSGEYYQAEGLSGSLEYQWYYSDEEEGEYEPIADATAEELTITSEYVDKYIKCAVTAVTDEGIKGEKAYSNVIKPLMKPEAENVEISGMVMSGMQISVVYDFYDENGDEEGETQFKWFVSDDGTNNWQEIDGEIYDTLTLDDSYEGKYIKAGVIPVSADEPYEGDIKESEKVGPVTGKDSLNLATNPGFETGTNKGWGVRNTAGDTAGFVANQEDAYSGEWSGKLSGQTSNSTYPTHYVKVKKGIKYIVSTMIKLAPESAIDAATISYYGEGHPAGTVVTRIGTTAATKDEWKQAIALVEPGADSNSFTTMPQYFAGSGGKGAVFYYDDYYFAPLLVDDVIVNVPESINIPSSGEVSSPIAISAIRNQLGTVDGLENEVAYWDVDEKGVYVKDNKIYVTSEAVSGKINLKVVVEPSFAGATQSIFVKNVPVELITNSNKTPKVTNAYLSGETTLGSTVKLTYDFYQVDGLKDESVIEWYVSDSENGSFDKIDGFSEKALNITSEYENKFLKVEITPVDSEGHMSTKVSTNIAGPKRKPEAKNVSVDGKGYVGDTLKGSYEYYDFNGDKEDETVIKWLKADSKNGTFTEISGANALEYVVKESDIGCWFKMEVTPVSVNEPYVGDTVLSDALQGPAAPTVTNVEIVKSGKVLIGKYKYQSINGVEEGDTICEWLINGRVVAKGTSYTVDFTGTKTVEFRVTPVGVTAPFEGESVSVEKKITNGASSSGGGGGGGSKVSSSILPPLPQSPSEEQKPEQKVSDVSGHWAEVYANEAVEKGIMPVDGEKKFYPDNKVTRAEMITYIFRAMGYAETEYRNEFGDVSAADSYAKMLQTMVDKGIISKDTNFRPNDTVTRQEVCKILSISLGFTESEFDLNKYSDVALIGDWAVPYVKNIINSNLMTGVSETEFSPGTNITNGQIAKIVSMIHSGKYNKPEVKNEQAISEKIDLSSNDIKVAFIGGSLTQQGKEWQDMTIEALKEKMPGKNITYINKGLGGTGSGYGAFRYQNDVLKYNPDIVFIEFAINDKSATGNSHSLYMEEMVRQSLRHEKQPAIIFIYAPNPTAIATGDFEVWQTGVDYKEKLAEYYGIKTVNISEYMLWDIEAQGVTNVQYIDELYKSTGVDSWDVHGGYVKYGEALVKAIDEDYESFLNVPKNIGAYHEENATDVNYSVISAVSDKITYNGVWTKCIQGEFEEFDANCAISEGHFEYFGGSLMQTLKGDTSFEFSTDAEAVKLQIISSKTGNSAKVYVDGVEKGTAETQSVNAGMNYDTSWVELPNDGGEHTVKYVIDAPSQDKYVFTVGSIIELRK